MKVGMLWLDDDKRRSFEDKVRQAADYYESKYGIAPDLCFVNDRSLTEAHKVDHVEVVPAVNILPHHFWVGVKPKPVETTAAAKSS